MRSDPTDNGGLFVGRRPGTAPVRYRALPTRGGPVRRRVDDTIAALLLVLMVLINLAFWGPIPAAGLWVGGRAQGAWGNIGVSLVVSFWLILAGLFGGLVVLKRIDNTWVLVRRAAGHDQRSGKLNVIFPFTAAVGVCVFTVWLIGFAGLGPELAPTG